ncbi:MAG: sigma-54-dependent transcriptional regulator [Candidatus Zhuqueibacterota bacterium]
MKECQTILLIDDDFDMHTICKRYIEKGGYQFLSARNGREGLEIIKAGRADLVLLDYMMPELDGAEVFQILRNEPHFEHVRDVPVIIMTVLSDNYVEKSELLKSGVALFLQKPFGFKELIDIIDNVFVTTAIRKKQREVEAQKIEEAERLFDENKLLKNQFQEKYSFNNIVTINSKMRQIFDKIVKIAHTDANILIYGESGTGKELIARSIHATSSRKDFSFVPVDCVALPASLMESELFGYERGAFTGAVNAKGGLIELANKGTFFLDEICELNFDLQAKLLRVLQERQFRRLGGKKLIHVDIRIISATNKNPERAMMENQLREDLYYRLNVIPIHVPPLRERKEDIPLLAEHFIKRFSSHNGNHKIQLSDQAMDIITEYQWPGNVRELQNLMERLVSLANSDVVDVDDLPKEILENYEIQHTVLSNDLPLKDARRQWIAQFERNYLLNLLMRCDGNISKVARIAQVNRMTIYRLLSTYNISFKKSIIQNEPAGSFR